MNVAIVGLLAAITFFALRNFYPDNKIRNTIISLIVSVILGGAFGYAKKELDTNTCLQNAECFLGQMEKLFPFIKAFAENDEYAKNELLKAIQGSIDRGDQNFAKIGQDLRDKIINPKVSNAEPQLLKKLIDQEYAVSKSVCDHDASLAKGYFGGDFNPLKLSETSRREFEAYTMALFRAYQSGKNRKDFVRLSQIELEKMNQTFFYNNGIDNFSENENAQFNQIAQLSGEETCRLMIKFYKVLARLPAEFSTRLYANLILD